MFAAKRSNNYAIGMANFENVPNAIISTKSAVSIRNTSTYISTETFIIVESITQQRRPFLATSSRVCGEIISLTQYKIGNSRTGWPSKIIGQLVYGEDFCLDFSPLSLSISIISDDTIRYGSRVRRRIDRPVTVPA